MDIFEVRTGIAVVAETLWQTKQAAAKVEVQSESMLLEAADSTTLRRDYAAALDAGNGVEGLVKAISTEHCSLPP